MKKILFLMLLAYTYSFAEIVVGKPFEQFSIKDQFGKDHQVKPSTKKVIFAFKKASGHSMKDYLKTKPKDFLAKNNAMYVADVTAMPSFIKFFVLPIKGYDFPIITLNDETLSKRYLNKEHIEKIMVVSLENFVITKIEYVQNAKEIF